MFTFHKSVFKLLLQKALLFFYYDQELLLIWKTNHRLQHCGVTTLNTRKHKTTILSCSIEHICFADFLWLRLFPLASNGSQGSCMSLKNTEPCINLPSPKYKAISMLMSFSSSRPAACVMYFSLMPSPYLQLQIDFSDAANVRSCVNPSSKSEETK